MTADELKPIIEAILFITADEPLTIKQLCEICDGESADDVRAAADALVEEYERRLGGFELRRVGGGLRFATRPEHSEYIRRFHKQQPSAKLSMAALETLAVIAYKQPVTIPEILEIRGVSSSSAIKTLLDKRLIVAKGRKKVVGRPMMYGTSKDFLLQFGLNDLSELPNLEDFEDIVTS
jgi:segregation and condensation protein B